MFYLQKNLVSGTKYSAKFKIKKLLQIYSENVFQLFFNVLITKIQLVDVSIFITPNFISFTALWSQYFFQFFRFFSYKFCEVLILYIFCEFLHVDIINRKLTLLKLSKYQIFETLIIDTFFLLFICLIFQYRYITFNERFPISYLQF